MDFTYAFRKGTSRWLSHSTIEFIPEAGALRPAVATGKVPDRIQGWRQKFSVYFQTLSRSRRLCSMSEMTITAASPDKASIEGRISDRGASARKVCSIIKYDYPDSQGRGGQCHGRHGSPGLSL